MVGFVILVAVKDPLSGKYKRKMQRRHRNR